MNLYSPSFLSHFLATHHLPRHLLVFFFAKSLDNCVVLAHSRSPFPARLNTLNFLHLSIFSALNLVNSLSLSRFYLVAFVCKEEVEEARVIVSSFLLYLSISRASTIYLVSLECTFDELPFSHVSLLPLLFSCYLLQASEDIFSSLSLSCRH